VVHRVFEPFYTGKEYGEGTGLGLFICNAIVMDHGGVIDVHSEQNKGTTFEVYLSRVPVSEVQDSDRGQGRASQYRGQGRASHGNETVLLVEDDRDVREVAADVLRHHGYAVLEAGDGDEALYVVESGNDRQVDLLFTDVDMPLMNGRELATRLRDVLPEFKLFYT
jgi:hypothetical protein